MDVSHLTKLGIPDYIVAKLNDLGYNELTDVQKRAIEAGLFENKSLIISAPTNTGKTFIAELAIIKSTLNGKRCFYLVPLKSIAEEKFEDFNFKYSDFGWKIAITTADRTEFDDNLLEYEVIIATFEKMLSLIVNNPKIMNEVGLVVIDELQIMGDPNRGFNLEILVTYLKLLENRPQIIAISATIPNAEEIAKWMDAELIKTEKRDVELREGVLYTGSDNIVFRGVGIRKGDFIFREFNSGKVSVERELSFDRIIKEQTIIFCKTQSEAQTLAKELARKLEPVEDIGEWIEKLDDIEETSHSKDLKACMVKGVAFHHAGMLPEERKIVEDAFRKGYLKIICCTPTLGAGVNTPAKNVIIRS